MSKDSVTYLNKAPYRLMKNSLINAFEELPDKVKKAPPQQWLATLKSFQNKGVKLIEIEDSGLIEWLASRPEQPIQRDEILAKLKSRQTTIKEIVLGKPRFRRHSHFAEGNKYAELLFVANSERDNLSDRVEEVEFEMESFNFDLERMSADPMAILRLEDERSSLLKDMATAHEFKNHHFSSVMNGLKAKNLVAHGRELIAGSLYLISEIQSDWAQNGRKNDWVNIPKGPFVTDTKAWAGMVARRMLQRAALNPEVKKVAWIRGYASNGGRNYGRSTETQAGLDVFYLKTINSIVEKAIAKTGEKTRFEDIHLNGITLEQLPCFEMTPAVRAQLMTSQPMYSHSKTWAGAQKMSDEDRAAVLKRSEYLLGSDKHVRFAKKLYDISTMREVSGSYMNKIIQISLNAQNPQLVIDHECFHFANEHLLNGREKEIILRDFAIGSLMQKNVIQKLNDLGQYSAAHQSASNPQEAAAHGFSLWACGQLNFNESASEGIFSDIKRVILDVMVWMSAFIRDEECKTAEHVFEKFGAGMHSQVEKQSPRSERPKMIA